MPKPLNVYLVGPMAVGKTTIGRNLAKALSFQFYDSDALVEQQTGATIAWIFDIEGEQGFRRREARVIDDVCEKRGIVLATGGGTVLTPSNRQQLQKNGTVFFLHTELDVLEDRSRQDEKRPMLQTDNMSERIEELWHQRLPLYREVADFQIKTSGMSVKQVCDEILKHLYDNTLLLS